jgi:ribosome-binding factor A
VSRRTERVSSAIRAILAEAIQNRLSDPRIEPLTSITRVEVSRDLSVARVYVSVMAEDARQKLSVQALRHATGRLRSLVAEQMTMRQVPQLRFRLDESVQRSFKTVQQLDRIMETLDQRPDQGTAHQSDDLDAPEVKNTADRRQPNADGPPAEQETGGGVDDAAQPQEDT